MRIHICQLDQYCQRFDPPPRINITHKGWLLSVAYWKDGSSQAWYPWSGSTKKWRLITIKPPRRRLCGHPDPAKSPQCSRLRGHRGRHRSITW